MSKEPTAMMFIGASPATIEAARDGLLRLMEAKADQETIRHAMSMFKEVVSVNGVHVSNCNLDSSTRNTLVVKVDEDEAEPNEDAE